MVGVSQDHFRFRNSGLGRSERVQDIWILPSSFFFREGQTVDFGAQDDRSIVCPKKLSHTLGQLTENLQTAKSNPSVAIATGPHPPPDWLL